MTEPCYKFVFLASEYLKKSDYAVKERIKIIPFKTEYKK